MASLQTPDLPDALRSAPPSLSDEARAIFDSMVTTMDFADAPARMLVVRFCEIHDQLAEAKKKLAESGPVFRDRWGQPRQSPWAHRELELTRELARLYRVMGLDQQRGGEQGKLEFLP